jgi:hypothetical protein
LTVTSSLKTILSGALLVVFGLSACGPARTKLDAGCFGLQCGSGGGLGSGGGTGAGGGEPDGGGNGTGGGGGSSSGGGAGGGGGAASRWDGGTSIAAVKQAKYCEDNVRVDNVVVTAIDSLSRGSKGDYTAEFWVADQNDPRFGLYVSKYFTDTPKDYMPKVGDVLSIEGWLQREGANTNRIAYREFLGSQFDCRANDGGLLAITVLDGGAMVADNLVAAGFGAADGGRERPNPEYRSARVHLEGPLVLVDPSPTALMRLSLRTNDTTYFGFEVSGGVLVNNYKTFDETYRDGGVNPRCDYRKFALDAGGGTVVFPNGLSGIWDTYSYPPCRDGGTSCGDGYRQRDAGVVPGTDNAYTYVLYPLDCADLPGYLDGGSTDAGQLEVDGGTSDGGESDAGSSDAGSTDAG